MTLRLFWILAVLVPLFGGCLGGAGGATSTIDAGGAAASSDDGSGRRTPGSTTSDAPAPEPSVGDATGSIIGQVLDDEQLPIPGATVTLIETLDEVHTDASGRFTFNEVPPGSYGLVAESIGYQDAARKADVAAGEVAEVTISLTPVFIPDAPYYVTVPKTAYIKAQSTFIGSFGYLYNSTALGVVGETCSPCLFPLYIDPTPYAVFEEVAWETSAGGPVLNTEIFVQYAYATASTFYHTGYMTNGANYTFSSNEVGELENETALELRVHGGLKSPSVELRPTVYTTFAYTAALPAGFTALPPK